MKTLVITDMLILEFYQYIKIYQEILVDILTQKKILMKESNFIEILVAYVVP